MNPLKIAVIGLTICLGNPNCSAQKVMIPFAQLEKDSTLPNPYPYSTSWLGSAESSNVSGAGLPSAGFIARPQASHARIASSPYYLLNGMHLGSALLDVAMTQHCLAAHTCREGNPIMPSSLAGQLGVDFGLVGYGAFTSYRLKKRGSGLWWLSPLVGAAAHSAGVASGFAHW